MNKFMRAQRKKIEVDKWCEGCSINQDPGQNYILEWIQRNGHWFRKAWDKSLCKNCLLSDECGFKVRSCCDYYKTTIKHAS